MTAQESGLIFETIMHYPALQAEGTQHRLDDAKAALAIYGGKKET